MVAEGVDAFDAVERAVAAGRWDPGESEVWCYDLPRVPESLGVRRVDFDRDLTGEPEEA